MVAVGIEHKGCFHFDLMSGRDKLLHPDYVGEKLNLQGPDAVGIAGLLDKVRQIFAQEAKA